MAEPSKNWVDRAVSYVAPTWAVRRLAAREMLASYRGGVQTRGDSAWGTRSAYTTQTTGEIRDIASLRQRARRADANNPIAHGILNRLVDNIVGEGFTLQAKSGVKAFDDEAEERWRDWLEVADVRGLMSGVEIQRQLVRAHEREGGVGMVLVDRGGQSRLQLIEADQLQTPDGKRTANLFHDGVEVNSVGRPVRFHVLTYPEGGKREFVPIDARNFVYYPRLKRINQVQGEPCFTQCFPLLDQVDAYVDAVVIAARMGAIFGLVFKESGAANAFGKLPFASNSQGKQQRAVTLENGAVKYIAPEDEVVQVQAQQPMSQTPDFIAAMMRLIGLPVDMPLELTLLDFSRVNFSSARASFLQFYRAMRAKQGNFRSVVLDRVYGWWIAREVNASRFTNPAPENYWRHVFMPRGWQWVDPVSEVQSAMMEVDLGIKTRAQVAAELGRDLAEILPELAAEKRAMEAVGLMPVASTMTRNPMAGVSNPQAPAEEPSNEPQDDQT